MILCCAVRTLDMSAAVPVSACLSRRILPKWTSLGAHITSLRNLAWWRLTLLSPTQRPPSLTPLSLLILSAQPDSVESLNPCTRWRTMDCRSLVPWKALGCENPGRTCWLERFRETKSHATVACTHSILCDKCNLLFQLPSELVSANLRAHVQ